MKKKTRIILMIVALIIGGAVFGGVKLIQEMNRGLEELSNTTIEEIDLSQINDGVYIGEYKIFPIEVKVRVTVLNHHISDVEIIKHVTGKGQPAEVIADAIVTYDSLQVELIAGATYSSIVILKAVENALHL